MGGWAGDERAQGPRGQGFKIITAGTPCKNNQHTVWSDQHFMEQSALCGATSIVCTPLPLQHMHHGYYPKGGAPKSNQQAQVGARAWQRSGAQRREPHNSAQLRLSCACRGR